jgi:tRNA dimethylallyltransferase
MGPTASGKTSLAVELLKHFPIELISVDSALVYKGMDIGTAKPDAEILASAPHHLIDIIDPTQSYSAAQFRADALRLMSDISLRGRIPLLVGGTMLYFNALQNGLNNLPQADAGIRQRLDEAAAVRGWPAMHARLAEIDPETAARLEPGDSQRIQRALEVWEISGKALSALFKEGDEDGASRALPYRLLKIALIPSDRAVLHQRIAARFETMIAQGLLKEVIGLRADYPTLRPDMPSMRCVGYRQALQHLDGEYGLDELQQKGIAATRQLAKRQLTWLRGMQDTAEVDCLDAANLDSTIHLIEQFINTDK